MSSPLRLTNQGLDKEGTLEAFRTGVAAAVALAVLSGTSCAAARSPLYPLTQCGPDFEHFCPIHGYFDSVPFHYNFAIYPGCLRTERVQTPRGMRRRLVLVCG
jgi:hypothetical protein